MMALASLRVLDWFDPLVWSFKATLGDVNRPPWRIHCARQHIHAPHNVSPSRSALRGMECLSHWLIPFAFDRLP